MRQLNEGGGMGFRVFDFVVDKRKLAKLATLIVGTLSPVVGYLDVQMNKMTLGSLSPADGMVACGAFAGMD